MTGPSSSPRGEQAGRLGAPWQISAGHLQFVGYATDERVVEDDAPDPAPALNRADRRRLARALKKGNRR